MCTACNICEMFDCTYTHTHTHICIYIYIYIYICVCVYIFIYLFIIVFQFYHRVIVHLRSNLLLLVVVVVLVFRSAVAVRATCPAHLILLDFITLMLFVEQYRSLTPHYAVFSTPLLPRPSQTQIFPSTPYSQTPSAYVPPAM